MSVAAMNAIVRRRAAVGCDRPRHERLERILATAQFQIDAQDLAVVALEDFRRSCADFSDCLIGRRNRAAGATETATFDRSLKVGLFRLL